MDIIPQLCTKHAASVEWRLCTKHTTSTELGLYQSFVQSMPQIQRRDLPRLCTKDATSLERLYKGFVQSTLPVQSWGCTKALYKACHEYREGLYQGFVQSQRGGFSVDVMSLPFCPLCGVCGCVVCVLE